MPLKNKAAAIDFSCHDSQERTTRTKRGLLLLPFLQVRATSSVLLPLLPAAIGVLLLPAAIDSRFNNPHGATFHCLRDDDSQ
jgi:hypothetical protein